MVGSTYIANSITLADLKDFTDKRLVKQDDKCEKKIANYQDMIKRKDKNDHV